MDTDDICVPDRFERQLNAFSENPGLDIIGGYISEFSDDMHNIISERTVPLGNYVIKQYQRKRDAFNHMTVMYKGLRCLLRAIIRTVCLWRILFFGRI